MKQVVTFTLVFLTILICLIFSIATTREIVAVAMAILLFSLPGLPIYKATFQRNTKQNPEAIFIGIAIGISLSSFFAVLVGYFIKWNMYTIAGSQLILWIIINILQKKLILTYNIQTPMEKNDYTILLVFLSMVLLSITYPFLNVGRLIDGGYAYAHMFGHDFILRASFAASLTHGIPPDYFNLTGNLLPTYWLFYVFPAFIYLVLGPSSSMQNIMLLTQVFYTLLFTAILFSVLRVILKKRISVIFSMVIGLCAYSYYDFYILFQNVAHRLPDYILVYINKYGLAEFSGISHSIFRVFLFEPQAIFVLTLILIIFLLFHKGASGSSEHARYPLIGLLMAFSLGIDAFIGIIVTIWCAVVFALELLMKGRISFRKSVPYLESFAIFSLVFLCYYLVDMYTLSSSNSGLLFKPYKMIILMLPVYFALEFGPAFLFGISGALILKKQSDRSNYTAVVLLACITLLFLLCIRHKVELNLGLRKGAYVLYIPLIIFCGVFFDYIFSMTRQNRKVITIVIALLVLATPTLFTDIYIASDIKDHKRTTYVSRADFNACKWIKENTPSNAIVQSEPEYPSPYEYSLIACFAERAMVIGESQMAALVRLKNIKEYNENRKQDIKRIFGATSASEAIDIIRKYRIDYIYVGPYERELYYQHLDKFDKHPEFFTKVYSKDGVNIYNISPN